MQTLEIVKKTYFANFATYQECRQPVRVLEPMPRSESCCCWRDWEDPCQFKIKRVALNTLFLLKNASKINTQLDIDTICTPQKACKFHCSSEKCFLRKYQYVIYGNPFLLPPKLIFIPRKNGAKIVQTNPASKCLSFKNEKVKRQRSLFCLVFVFFCSSWTKRSSYL